MIEVRMDALMIMDGRYVCMSKMLNLQSVPAIGSHVFIDRMDNYEEFEEAFGDWSFDGIEIKDVRFYENGMIVLHGDAGEIADGCEASFIDDMQAVGFTLNDEYNKLMGSSKYLESLYAEA